ncbi:oxygen-independent coproporphyrinogen III oxidase [Membranicola marinus]|uniref:Coproporphyrinogen-III oxidase n=1 Tax=Membranihabitans marinus TaxID=1227546 RepID=A0A953HR09_9BACT|nr:oxygen-independent coproporphyrinogen III oxidase [Membranihabitans marinus]MBY5956800.1 oxygen-independent coproporphyrinogen III oxidase [Membranihabitans marinus]
MKDPLIDKYNVPGPRYTSYPTVPYWQPEFFSVKKWMNEVESRTKADPAISLYIHLPFCEKLCTFCGCHKRITVRHEVEDPYIAYLLREWQQYHSVITREITISELHLGGGTPTFFSPTNLAALLDGLFQQPGVNLPDRPRYSFEGHPNNTTKQHLETLYQYGFRRVSFGVQDYNERIQKAINRIQPYDHVQQVTMDARAAGYESVGHDLIFGLPFQTLADIRRNIKYTQRLMPERIAFYSYAHVPWIKGTGQRGFDASDLPPANLKRDMYEYGKEQLQGLGYEEIGFDHFALPGDALSAASRKGTLHRNFMGYTEVNSTNMIGLGVSAISDMGSSFAQNEKNVERYYELLDAGKSTVTKGHHLDHRDQVIRRHLLNLTCRLETSWNEDDMKFDVLPEVLDRLEEPLKDNLIQISNNTLSVTDRGRPFIRNICMAFDLHLHQNQPENRIFSMTV